MPSESFINYQESNQIILTPEAITRENFAQFGEFAKARGNRKVESDIDLDLDIKRGVPLLYIMRLDWKPLEFSQISRHLNCSQCLGSVNGDSWYIAVCPADNDSNIPDLSEIKLFLIPPNSFIKLNTGTWHQGPYFTYPHGRSFLNLEHVDTVQNDYETYTFNQKYIIEH
jgi:ureidoglycolate hydrolase